MADHADGSAPHAIPTGLDTVDEDDDDRHNPLRHTRAANIPTSIYRLIAYQRYATLTRRVAMGLTVSLGL